MDILLILLTILAFTAAAIFAVAAWRVRADAGRHAAARVAALASTLTPSDASASDPPRPVAVAAMFDATVGARAGHRPFGPPAIATALATVLVIGAGMVLRQDPQPAAARSEVAPLELITMRHVREGHTLRVTGLVRNPPAGAPLAGVAALVLAFDRRGEFVASGRAAIDVPTLQPGDQSPFVVEVSDLAEVGRYRVSFRTDAGLLRHIDRRAVPHLVRAR
jgi:hypothetical protein